MPDTPSTVEYRFAGFELRPLERALLRDGKPATVGPRAFDLLVALVERAGTLVTTDELLTRVWPKLVVEENNLQVQVSALRKVLGNDAIATVAGHGYRFTRPVTTHCDDVPSAVPSRALPQVAGRFIGREAEINECTRRFEDTRLLTLVGVGGIGKTRLSIELANTVAERFRDGVAFVELAPIEDPRSIVGAIAAALGVSADPKRSLIELLLHYLADREQLIVLDNCEHLIGACAAICMQLLRSSKGMKLLATSREPLRMHGETVYHVPTLPSPHEVGDVVPEVLHDFAAVALFVDRASASDWGFDITAENGFDVATICRKLDGIPLAIELAASRVRVMSVRTIAEHLDEQFQVLVGGDRSAPPRQQTLQATLDWSHRLLSDPERSMFRRLSVFAGGFLLDAAQVVGIGDDVTASDVLYVLPELVDKSLIVFEPRSNRYRMLEPVRQYALERLVEAGKEAEARDAHLRFHVDWARSARPEIRTQRQAELIGRIVAERDNFAVAFAHARDKADGGPAGLAMTHPTLTALKISGYLDLCRRMGREALAHAGAQEDSVARARALHSTASIEYWMGRYDEACAMSEEGVSVARRCGDARVLAEALNGLANVNVAIGKTAEARACLVEGLRLATDVGDHKVASSAHCSLGELDSLEGNIPQAQEHYLQSLALNSDELDVVVNVRFAYSRNAALLGKEDTALRYLRDGLAAMGDARATAYIQWTLCLSAWAAVRRNDHQRALRLFGAAIAHRQRIGFYLAEPDASVYARALQLAREAAGPAADEAYAAGVATHEDAAMAEAVEWIATLPEVAAAN
jgi:non-specific serine/threonine protein kinase